MSAIELPPLRPFEVWGDFDGSTSRQYYSGGDCLDIDEVLDRERIMLAKIAELEADAERYRWIRSQGASWETEAVIAGLTPEQYDAAVDFARGLGNEPT